VTRYENQEFRATVESRVAGEECFVLGSIVPACATIQDPRITVLPVAPVLREKLMRAGLKAEAASSTPLFLGG